MSVLNLTREYLAELWELRDVRADAYPLTDSPWPTIYLCLAYLLFVKIVGPYLMRDRPAFDLKGAMMVYNVFQVGYSAWHASLALRGGWWFHYSFRCEPCNYSTTDPRALLMLQAYWHYYFSKFLDFTDTIFFVLRKKNEQVSIALRSLFGQSYPLSVMGGSTLAISISNQDTTNQSVGSIL